MGRFKGRVTEIHGTLITIDTAPNPVERCNPDGTRTQIESAWLKPELPALGAVVRCNFHSKDRR